MNYELSIDFHAHHPSLHGERCFQQDVDNIGIHPWDITQENAESMIVDFENKLMKSMLKTPVEDVQHVNKLLAIGECGLDKCCEAPMELQQRVFRHQVKQSEVLRLPLILHCVKAVEEMLLIRHELRPQQPWIFHGFRGKPQQLQQLLRDGFYVSFGPLHNEASLQECPLDRMFLETDDTQHDIRELYKRVAQIKGVSLSTLLYNIKDNLLRINPNVTI